MALADALERGSSSPSSSSSSSYAAAAKHDAVSASVAAADAVALLAWGSASEALGAAADAGDTAISSVDDLLLKNKNGWSGSGKNGSTSGVQAGPLRSAEAIERAAVGAVAGKAVSTLDAAAGALINKTRASWSDKARPWLSRAAEALSDAKGGEPLPVDAEGRLEVGVGSALAAADSKRVGLRAAADAKIAEKLAGGSKAIGEMGILVSLQLGNDPLDPGVRTVVRSSSSSSSFSSSVPSLENATSATTASVSSRVLSADGWDPSLLSNTGGPDFYFDQQLVSARAVSDAFEALVRSRLAADGVSGLAQRLASAAVALDSQRGLFEVRLAWRSGGSGSALASAIAAVNDADPRDPCRSWAEHFDVCSAIQQSSVLNVASVHARADTAPPGAHAGRMQLGRRLRGFGLPSTVGSPQVLEYEVPDGGGGGGAGGQAAQAFSITQGNLKDLYWYIDKAIEGATNFANGYKDWQGIGKVQIPRSTDAGVQRVASDASKKWAAGLTQALGAARGLLAVVGSALFVLSLVGAFLPAQPDPIIMGSLNTIQVVTNETLTRVKEIQTTLGVIEQTLDSIRKDIAKSSCTLALTTIDASVTELRRLYRLYYGPLDFKGEDQGYVGDLAEYLAVGKQPDPTLKADVEKWVDDVLKPSTGVTFHIDYIYGRISGRVGLEESVLRQCRNFFVNKVADSGPMPIDDRVLYADMTKVVTVRRLVTFLCCALSMLAPCFTSTPTFINGQLSNDPCSLLFSPPLSSFFSPLPSSPSPFFSSPLPPSSSSLIIVLGHVADSRPTNAHGSPPLEGAVAIHREDGRGDSLELQFDPYRSVCGVVDAEPPRRPSADMRLCAFFELDDCRSCIFRAAVGRSLQLPGAGKTEKRCTIPDRASPRALGGAVLVRGRCRRRCAPGPRNRLHAGTGQARCFEREGTRRGRDVIDVACSRVATRL